jgi:hypothetical protein
MEITKKSVLTGNFNTRTVDISEETYEQYLRGEISAASLTNLSVEDFEFITLGIVPEEIES